MLNFPKSTEFGRIIPKEAFYKNLSLSTEMKDKFVSYIKKIVWQYKLSADTLNLEKGNDVSEILVLAIELKKKAFDRKILELISKQNTHKVIYILSFEDTYCLGIYVNKVYISAWQNDISLEIKGLNLDSVWDNFVCQIAIDDELIENVGHSSVDELLQLQEEKQKLQKELLALENKIRTTKQFNLQVKLKQELKRLKEKNKYEI